MVRILCLHGFGSNSEIFEIQLEGIRSLLPAHYEWHFEDAEEECPAAPGAEGIFPPPFFCHYVQPSCENIEEVVELIDSIIESEGPFDAVLGFSQGGSIAATMLLRHQILNPHAPPLFRVAVFLCANLPWSWSTTYGLDVTSLLLQGRSKSTDLNEWKRAAATPPRRGMTEAFLDDLPEPVRDRVRENAKGIKDDEIPSFRRFHPLGGAEKINIPTVHLYGLKDHYCQQSQALIDFCDKGVACVVESTGGHEIPRDKKITKDLADGILRAFTRADLMN